MTSKPIPTKSPASGPPALRTSTFRKFQELLHERVGIFLGPPRMSLLTSRLATRLRARGCEDFESYLDLVLSDKGQGGEFQAMVNRITTNKTDFFREDHHFRYLEDVIRDRSRGGISEAPRVWSAGCSTGEEPYSIAMVLAATRRRTRHEQALIEASDIDTHVLARAAEGAFPLRRFESLEPDRWQPWFLKGTGQHAGVAKAREELRKLITFRQHNLVGKRWPANESFDVIFCRNTLIYFDRQTQHTIVKRLAQCLKRGGTLFLGHSENLLGEVPELASIGQTIFQRRDAGAPEVKRAVPAARPFDARVVAGGMFCSASPAVVQTLLGSCVAACLYDPVARIGGMNHFLLPEGRLEGAGRALAYGVHAMESLVNEIMKRGGDRRRLRAKLFGGASVLANFRDGGRVAERNRAFAIRYLETEGIELVSHRLGGKRPLSVRFETHTGRAFVRQAGSERRQTTARSEAAHFRQVSQSQDQAAPQEPTLFEPDTGPPGQTHREDEHE